LTLSVAAVKARCWARSRDFWRAASLRAAAASAERWAAAFAVAWTSAALIPRPSSSVRFSNCCWRSLSSWSVVFAPRVASSAVIASDRRLSLFSPRLMSWECSSPPRAWRAWELSAARPSKLAA
jgi:hypothetical protein